MLPKYATGIMKCPEVINEDDSIEVLRDDIEVLINKHNISIEHLETIAEFRDISNIKKLFSMDLSANFRKMGNRFKSSKFKSNAVYRVLS